MHREEVVGCFPRFRPLLLRAAAEAADFLLQANALLAELVQQEKVAALEQKKVDIEFVELLKEIRSSLRALVPQPLAAAVAAPAAPSPHQS